MGPKTKKSLPDPKIYTQIQALTPFRTNHFTHKNIKPPGSIKLESRPFQVEMICILKNIGQKALFLKLTIYTILNIFYII